MLIGVLKSFIEKRSNQKTDGEVSLMEKLGSWVCNTIIFLLNTNNHDDRS